jgi:hypothetical protein
VLRLLLIRLEALALIKRQSALIRQQEQMIDRLTADVAAVDLQCSRITRDLIAQFLIVLEQPELNDVARDGLWMAWREFSDHVARLEEMTA